MKQISINRRELKYYINYADYLYLIKKISNIFFKDKHSNEAGWYHIRSIYFDNKTNDNYYEKIEGIEKRKKYRIRVYNLNKDPVKLEIKSKMNNLIFKESLAINVKDADKIIRGDFNCLLNYKNPIANRIYSDFCKDYYKPVIIIDYRRDAYYLDLNNIRVTFDNKIEKEEIRLGNLFKDKINMSSVLNNKKIIMEVKYNHNIPIWIKKILQLPRFERCSLSKYTLSRYMQ